MTSYLGAAPKQNANQGVNYCSKCQEQSTSNPDNRELNLAGMYQAKTVQLKEELGQVSQELRDATQRIAELEDEANFHQSVWSGELLVKKRSLSRISSIYQVG